MWGDSQREGKLRVHFRVPFWKSSNATFRNIFSRTNPVSSIVCEKVLLWFKRLIENVERDRVGAFPMFHFGQSSDATFT